MRTLVPALGCLLVAAKASIACSVVRVVETLPSSPNVRLTVLKDNTPQQNATLVVSLQINAQQVGPPLKTDARGSAELRNLAPGTYCITATADPRLGADLCLVVSKGRDRERSEFSLKLTPLPPPPPTLAEHRAGKEPILIKLEAGEDGRFFVPLSPGKYTAAFQSPGFTTLLVGFAIGAEESQELAPIVLQVGSCT